MPPHFRRFKQLILQLWRNRVKPYLRAAWSDVRDWVRGERDPLVPPRYRLHAGWRGDSGRIADRWVRAAHDVGGLRPGDRVLDIGCGPGRIAAPLTRQVEDGSYEGFDIVPRSIGWCQRKIATRHPRFRFQLADIRNAQYNPTGSQEAGAYTFPYSNSEFDLALAASVFTHMLPGEIQHYLSEAARVLRPEGRLLASFFLLNNDIWRRLMVSHRHALGPEQSDGGIPYRTRNSQTPEYMIAVPESNVREIYERAGLTIESIHYGRWCGRRNTDLNLGQDLVVARRGARGKASA